MRISAVSAIGAAALLLFGCATSYGPQTLTGGYSETHVAANVWRITFSGNGYTTEETVQTYWLYHCADVALREGYDGFRIITPVKLTALEARPRGDEARLIEAHGGGGGGAHFVYVPLYVPSAPAPTPWLTGEIMLMKAPLAPDPGHTFDARSLQSLLGRYVLGDKCSGNVCPHVHSYLYPTPAPGT